MSATQWHIHISKIVAQHVCWLWNHQDWFNFWDWIMVSPPAPPTWSVFFLQSWPTPWEEYFIIYVLLALGDALQHRFVREVSSLLVISWPSLALFPLARGKFDFDFFFFKGQRIFLSGISRLAANIQRLQGRLTSHFDRHNVQLLVNTKR